MKYQIRRIQLTDKYKILFLIFAILGIEIGLILLSIWLYTIIGIKLLVYTFGYLIIFHILDHLLSDSNNHRIQKFLSIVSIPLNIGGLWLQLTFPFITILLSFFFLIFYAFGVPFIVTTVTFLILDFKIPIATITFITLAIGSITSVHCSRTIKKLIIKQSVLKNRHEHLFEPLMIDLALYVIQKNNINFIIYFAYFVFLTIHGFLQIHFNMPLINTEIDNAILNAFLVFIAYSNMRKKSEEIEIEPKPLLEKMLKLMTIHDR